MKSRLVLGILILVSLLAVPPAAGGQPLAAEDTASAMVIESSLANHFVHIVTPENTQGWFTMLQNPALDGNPNARIIVTRLWINNGLRATYNDHYFAVVYMYGHWYICNQGKFDFEMGVAFNVVVPTVGYNNMLVRATADNTYGNLTVIDSPFLNGNPGAVLFATQNITPGDGSEHFNEHPFGVWYTGSQWSIYNEDGAPMPVGASFNLLLALPTYTALVHQAQAGNIDRNWTLFTHPRTDNNDSVLIFVTPNWVGTYDPHPIGVFNDDNYRWGIYNEQPSFDEINPMPAGANFNILIIGNKTYLPGALRMRYTPY